MKLSELSNTELESLARARKNPYYLSLRRFAVDIQLLSHWFHKGYSSREMATFYLISEMNDPENSDAPWTPERVEQRWAELHDEVVKLVYKT